MRYSFHFTVILFLFCSGPHFPVAVNPSHAATFIVNSPYDINDLSPGNGLCVAYLLIQPPFVHPLCTLRAAVEEANSLPGTDTIIVPEGTYFLALAGAAEDASATGDLDITDSLVLAGGGQGKTFIDGMQLDRVLDIIKSDITVTVSDITVANGLIPSYLPANQKTGGGVRNSGTLILKRSSVDNNRVAGPFAQNMGGGLANHCICSIDNSTLRNNSAARGGAIANASGAALRISASTIYQNSAESGGGLINLGSVTAINATFSGNVAGTTPDKTGGAIQNRNESTLIHCTIAGNMAAAGGGGISNDGMLAMVNTIVADNEGGNCRLGRSIDTRGHNMASDGSCSLDHDLDIENVNPYLETLRDNGGLTWTHALGQNSPAIDRGILLAEVPVDQRGIHRPQRKNADIGAFEIEPAFVAPLISPLLLK